MILRHILKVSCIALDPILFDKRWPKWMTSKLHQKEPVDLNSMCVPPEPYGDTYLFYACVGTGRKRVAFRIISMIFLFRQFLLLLRFNVLLYLVFCFI